MTMGKKTLRRRLILSHLAVVVIGMAVIIVAGPRLGTVFVDSHLDSMSMMGSIGADSVELEEGIRLAFRRSIFLAASISAVTAMVAALIASRRVLQPLEEVRQVARRLATGSYSERVPLPSEEELEGLARDVNSLAQSLENVEGRRRRLISEVAHELRTPLATLKGYLEGLLDGVFEADDETLAAALRETRRMERLADDLNALSKAEEGQPDLNLAVSDLNDVAAEIVTRLRPQFDDQAVRLDVVTGQPVIVNADVDRVAQVLTNLVGNALSFTPPGGNVVVRVQQDNRVARVTVEDTGRGLTSEQVTGVFERFYRADRSAVGGSGIGLTIARSLARLHGGDVTATSEGLGRGSTFIFTLPAHRVSAKS